MSAAPFINCDVWGRLHASAPERKVKGFSVFKGKHCSCWKPVSWETGVTLCVWVLDTERYGEGGGLSVLTSIRGPVRQASRNGYSNWPLHPRSSNHSKNKRVQERSESGRTKPIYCTSLFHLCVAQVREARWCQGYICKDYKMRTVTRREFL